MEELADRAEGYLRPDGKVFESLVPLPEVIAASTGKSAAGVRVQRMYQEMIRRLGDEFSILRNVPAEDIRLTAGTMIAEGISRLRRGEVKRKPGFDGEYGTIQLFEPWELDNVDGQISLALPSQDIVIEEIPTEIFRKAETPDASVTEAAASKEPEGIIIERHDLPGEIFLNENQKEAVTVLARAVSVKAGPGTGKTTTINTIIHYFDQEDMDILLAAPTGRAAKRMTEATGYEAKTIHRLLELTGAPAMDSKSSGNSGENRLEGMHFERNEENPLDADVIIIDEMSMVDISLIHSLLKAVNVGTRLILVGDVNQLPSVGPGNVLRDMIASEAFPVVKLTKIFRQAAQSDIIVNAHKINDGEAVPLNKKSRDFLFIRRDYPADIVKDMMVLVQDKLPNYVHAEMSDIQIMTPMRKGALGVEALNKQLQEKFNPPAPNKQEKESGGTIFRVGDKVMQIKNNYQIEWEVRNRYGIPVDKGEGVFNGDTGIIRSINSFAETMEVEFDERRMVEYSFKQLEELELAVRDHDPQIPGKRISGSGDPGPFGTADADDGEI